MPHQVNVEADQARVSARCAPRRSSLRRRTLGRAPESARDATDLRRRGGAPRPVRRGRLLASTADGNLRYAIIRSASSATARLLAAWARGSSSPQALERSSRRPSTRRPPAAMRRAFELAAGILEATPPAPGKSRGSSSSMNRRQSTFNPVQRLQARQSHVRAGATGCDRPRGASRRSSEQPGRSTPWDVIPPVARRSDDGRPGRRDTTTSPADSASRRVPPGCSRCMLRSVPRRSGADVVHGEAPRTNIGAGRPRACHCRSWRRAKYSPRRPGDVPPEPAGHRDGARMTGPSWASATWRSARRRPVPSQIGACRRAHTSANFLARLAEGRSAFLDAATAARLGDADQFEDKARSPRVQGGGLMSDLFDPLLPTAAAAPSMDEARSSPRAPWMDSEATGQPAALADGLRTRGETSRSSPGSPAQAGAGDRVDGTSVPSTSSAPGVTGAGRSISPRLLLSW